MDQKALKVLEYDKIMTKLMERTVSSLGRTLVEALEPVSDFEKVANRLKETSDALAYLWRKGGAPFGGVHDIRGSIKRVEIGATLGIAELMRVGDCLRCCRIMKQYLTNDIPADWEGNLALEMGRQIVPSRTVEDAISTAIISEEEISDQASPELASIRRSIRHKQDSIKDIAERHHTLGRFQEGHAGCGGDHERRPLCHSREAGVQGHGTRTYP
jgi:DNA mismatch repair protein MutS2